MRLRPVPVLLWLLAAWGGWFWWDGRPVRRPPGALAPGEPRQTPLEREDLPFEMKGFHLVPLARYAVKARVLSRERYRFDHGAGLAPVDLALGWGPMSDSAVLKGFDISQSNRWYYWQASELPIPESDVIAHSANTHMIPADALARRVLLDAKAGDVLELDGYLVRVDGPRGFIWMSSLSRTDTGDGSCELMYVKEARRGPR